ncbi:hypothetical protein PENVUL_c086G00613 [Penicillium vulpinum]|uniref:Uncharacterized protein n=1 Tax=Penicillium vulpinum TaxID=29845 RepID=A0A1V6R6T2_9EURO|nr:hypothetical protein PENVUL_c086G00613 [Penicillium vulpinum]
MGILIVVSGNYTDHHKTDDV